MITRATLVTRPGRVRLDRIDPEDTGGLTKDEAAKHMEKLAEEFGELEDLLAYAGEHALLVVLQGRDAAGKDGAIRRVLQMSNMQAVRVEPFKVPTEQERAHDFLWRVHARVPQRGQMVIFNRSHYEDVIAARVYDLVPKHLWRRRYDAINAFEDLLADANTVVLKFFLHISKGEQKARLLAREKDPRKAWKLNPGDWRERKLWRQTTAAYEDAIGRCASPSAPWIVVPADHKWYRDLVIMDALVDTLRPLKKTWMRKLDTIGKAARVALVRARREA